VSSTCRTFLSFFFHFPLSLLVKDSITPAKKTTAGTTQLIGYKIMSFHGLAKPYGATSNLNFKEQTPEGISIYRYILERYKDIYHNL